MRPIIVVMDLNHEWVTCHWQWDTPVGHGLQMKVVTRTSFNARSGGTSHGGLRPHQTSLQMARLSATKDTSRPATAGLASSSGGTGTGSPRPLRAQSRCQRRPVPVVPQGTSEPGPPRSSARRGVQRR